MRVALVPCCLLALSCAPEAQRLAVYDASPAAGGNAYGGPEGITFYMHTGYPVAIGPRPYMVSVDLSFIVDGPGRGPDASVRPHPGELQEDGSWFIEGKGERCTVHEDALRCVGSGIFPAEFLRGGGTYQGHTTRVYTFPEDP